MRYKILFFIISFCFSVTIYAQQANAPENSISDLIGLTLDELFGRFGVPQSVHAVRGLESWQDDVVFVYADNDFYMYRNRVWQVGVKSAYGFKIGDTINQVAQRLGTGIKYYDDYFLYTLPGRGWPLMLRVNVDKSQLVSAIFIYRSDL